MQVQIYNPNLYRSRRRADTLPRIANNGLVGLGQQPLELGVLGFELAQALGFRDLHAAEPGAPLVESGVAETAVAAQLLDRHAGFGLLEEPNDLFLNGRP